MRCPKCATESSSNGNWPYFIANDETQRINKTFSLHWCPDCSLGFIAPFPTDVDMNKLYDENYSSYIPSRQSDISQSIKHCIGEFRFYNYFNNKNMLLEYAARFLAILIELVTGKQTSYLDEFYGENLRFRKVTGNHLDQRAPILDNEYHVINPADYETSGISSILKSIIKRVLPQNVFQKNTDKKGRTFGFGGMHTITIHYTVCGIFGIAQTGIEVELGQRHMILCRVFAIEDNLVDKTPNLFGG